VGGLALGTVGCQTYRRENKIIGHWQRGDLLAAEKEANKKARKEDNTKDAVIWRLEQGAVLRAVDKHEASNEALSLAEAKIDRYSERAKVRLANEAGALLSNQANLPYEGRPYDGIMLNTYKALNYLTLGQPEAARVELIRAYYRQQDAVDLNRKRIARTQEELEKSPQKDRIHRAENSPELQGRLDQTYASVNEMPVYADYVNPFTVYLDGLFFMVNATGNSDLERARKSLERAAAFAPGNACIEEDIETLAALFAGKALTPTTYVILETGRAPLRDQIRIDIPLFVTTLSYIGAAFPTLEPQGDFLPRLTVEADGATQATQVVANMDGVIGLDFKNQLPTVITKTIASAVAKGVATYAINDASRRANDTAGVVAQIFTALYQLAVNIADTRTWTTLPKEFQVCRVPTPDQRVIEMSGPGGAPKMSVTVEPGTINVIYVRSITANSPLLVSQMKLK